MTVEEILSQSLLAVSGGVLTPDVNERWGEAKTYLAMSVNAIMTGTYWMENRADGDKASNPLLYMAFDNIAIQFSTDHQRHYATLPKRVVTLPKGRAIEITTMAGVKCFPLNVGDADLEEFYGCHKDWISYQLEGAYRVWLYNVSPLLTAIRPKYMVHLNDLDDTDEVLLPSDGETKVIAMMVEFLMGQRKANKDYTEDTKPN